ncbi:MAG: hypothetical protein HW388_578 [Dehalococcoidia bacterium]|nr:hypothetical protein [Dehalococcoidia bacterium]
MSCLSCGRVFPIRDGVPRLYLGAIADHRDFMERHHIPLPSREQIEEDLSEARDKKRTRQSFSREWHQFEYRTDKTFDWDIEERKSLFFGRDGVGEGFPSGQGPA